MTSIWFVAALVFFGIASLFGSIFMLTLSVATVFTAIFSLLDDKLSHQLFACGILTFGSLIVLAFYIQSSKKFKPNSNNTDGGNKVVVRNINDDGSARVQYRGTDWKAVSEDDKPLQAGIYRILKIDGIVLVLKTRK